MGSSTNRLSALVAIIALSQSCWGRWSGWRGTSDARMACCAQEEQCPMHAGDSGPGTSHRIVTQTDADDCCAVSGTAPSTPSGVSQVQAALLAIVSAPAAALLPDPALIVKDHRIPVSIDARPVPRHLLLSVFLV